MQGIAATMESHKEPFSVISETVGHRKRLCDEKVVEGGEFIPQLPPAIDISVLDLEA